MLLARTLLLLLLFRSLTASPACKSNALLACLALAIYVYLYTVYSNAQHKNILTLILFYFVLTESVVS